MKNINSWHIAGIILVLLIRTAMRGFAQKTKARQKIPETQVMQMFVTTEESFKGKEAITDIENIALKQIRIPGISQVLEGYLGMLDDQDIDVGPYNKNQWSKQLSSIEWLVIPFKDAEALAGKLGKFRINAQTVSEYFDQDPRARKSVSETHTALQKALRGILDGQMLVVKVTY